jgi:hypothetical protein
LHDLFDQRYKRTLQRAALAHINLIARSSFRQTVHEVSSIVTQPGATKKAYTLEDHARWYFLDRALVAFELHEDRGKEKMCCREAWAENGENVLWSVWWWANSEDKARAKMERWRVVSEPRVFSRR